MSRPFQPTESKSLFVGRERELKQITGILDSGKPARWLIQIHGDGGIGKTRLLESLRDPSEWNPSHLTSWVYWYRL
jgi:hypothetical protein